MAIALGVLFAVCAVCTALPGPPLPVLKETPAEVIFVSSDKPLLLECKLASGDPSKVKFTWQKDGKPLGLEGINQRPGEGSLEFPKPKAKDAGQYQCFAISNSGTASTRVIQVSEAFINTPTSELKKIQPTEGKPFKMDCDIPESYPKPQIAWQKHYLTGNKVEEVKDARITIAPEGTLYVASAEKSDVSKDFKYVCVARTPAKKGDVVLAEYMVEDLKENKKPDNEVYEQYTSKDMTVKAGEQLYLYCIYGGTPLAHPDWYKGSKNVNGARESRITRYNQSKGKRLLFKEVLLTDAGTFKCVVDNEKSKPKEHTIKLTVVSAPEAEQMPTDVTKVEAGKDITIPCRVAGEPAPHISWTYNSQPLKTNQRITIKQSIQGNVTISDLTVHGAQPTDKGYYGCKAGNEYGNLYNETLLHVA